MFMSEKEIISLTAVTLGMAGTLLYLREIFRRGIKPHAFSWIIWGVLTAIGFFVQHAVAPGPGTWNLGFCAAGAFLIAGISCFRGEKNITRGDWIAFAAALLAIPVWQATSSPLWAVVMISLIDTAAFYPTFRKSWLKPREESALVFGMATVQFLLSIFSLEPVTLTSALYPAVLVAANGLLVLMLVYRRRALKV